MSKIPGNDYAGGLHSEHEPVQKSVASQSALRDNFSGHILHA